MVALSDAHALLLQAMERVEAALSLLDDTMYPTSAFLIERALDQLRVKTPRMTIGRSSPCTAFRQSD